ncbi:MAG: ATP synthase subunit I [Janthinobacterium lividum]
MFHLVLLQLATTIITALIAGLISGSPALISALLGGLCCVVPNALFAVRLFASAQKGAANPVTFFFGELIKIALTIAALGAVVWLYRDLNWLALIAAFIVALKSYIFLLFRH